MEENSLNYNKLEEDDEFNLFYRRIVLTRYTLIYFILLVFGFTVIFSIIIKRNDERKKLKTEDKIKFFETVDKAIFSNDSLMMNIESIKMVFNSLDRESDGLFYKYGFINLLEDYLVRNSLDSSRIKILKNSRIYDLIKKELEQEPYSRLTSEQRRLLINLDKSLQDGDSLLAKFNLIELNDMLRNQNDNIEKLELQNTWSLFIGITGTVLTIVFGLITILRPGSAIKTEQLIDSITKKPKPRKTNKL